MLSKLSKKVVSEMTLDKILEQLGNNYAYFTVTGSKVRQDNITVLENEIRKRVNK